MTYLSLRRQPITSKLYLEQRSRGTDDMLPREITDESPLLRTYERELNF